MNDLKKFGKGMGPGSAASHLKQIINPQAENPGMDVLMFLFSCIDLTTLNTEDNDPKVIKLCQQVNRVPAQFPGMPNVAAICVFPSLVKTVRRHLKAENVSIASVSGGFPSSQTFPQIKVMESQMAVDAGAEEIDMVISVGKFLEGEYEFVWKEIRSVKDAIGHVHLKVILETGILNSYENIRLSSLIALDAGADFIKTSTGKTPVSATPEAVFAMAEALRDYHRETGRRAGLKPSGGIVRAEDALSYNVIVREILGTDWLTPSLFRLGASRLANNLLTGISLLKSGKENPVEWF